MGRHGCGLELGTAAADSLHALRTPGARLRGSLAFAPENVGPEVRREVLLAEILRQLGTEPSGAQKDSRGVRCVALRRGRCGTPTEVRRPQLIGTTGVPTRSELLVVRP